MPPRRYRDPVTGRYAPQPGHHRQHAMDALAAAQAIHFNYVRQDDHFAIAAIDVHQIEDIQNAAGNDHLAIPPVLADAPNTWQNDWWDAYRKRLQAKIREEDAKQAAAAIAEAIRIKPTPPKRDAAEVWAFVKMVRAILRDPGEPTTLRAVHATLSAAERVHYTGKLHKFATLIARRHPFLYPEDCPVCAQRYIPVPVDMGEVVNMEGDVLVASNFHSEIGHYVCLPCAETMIRCRRCLHLCSGDYHHEDDEPLCRTCFRRLPRCYQCDTTYHLTQIDERYYCDNHIDVLSICERCNNYYYGNRCRRPECAICNCEAPVKEFYFPINAGRDVLASDQPHEIALPSGKIAPEGLDAICDELFKWCTGAFERGYGWRRDHMPGIVLRVGHNWMEKSGGSFTKRLSRYWYKEYGKTMGPEILTTIGNIAKQHTIKESTHRIEFTRNLNAPAHEFAHADSCWWGGSKHSRCALKGSGGLGVRTFDAEGRPDGRAWIMPLDRNLQPQDDCQSAAAFFVFNGYGTLANYAPAQLVSMLTGLSYRKIAVNCPHDTMYINNEQGFLVASPEIIDEFATTKKILDLRPLKGKHGTIVTLPQAAPAQPRRHIA